ncbi:MAG: metalloregulator ArsR/SmtB family transcription factor [Candidatus Magnetoovum sp. WYHC-5]|nr:metalloregulator ArsR/SmtB family transcription factor [Candidatus Magnetoovum sp. WYHC-5]
MRPLDDKIELLKVIAHPTRIKILYELMEGVKCVSDFEKFLGKRQPNISQHLTLLRNHNIVDFYIDGKLRCYFLVEPMVPDILQILEKQYEETLPLPTCCPVSKR